MIIERIDLSNRAVDVFDGTPALVKSTMFGAIATSIRENYFEGYSAFTEQASLGLLRWPGGTLAEKGVVTADNQASLTAIGDGEFAYDLRYPDLLHPDLLSDGSGLATGRPGLSAMLELAAERGTAFSMILPTERYADAPERAYDDVSAFLSRLFVEGAYNGGRLPGQIILDIGNENYNPGNYGSVAVSILAAIRDFRADHPAINFDAALQAMQSGAETRALISVLQDPVYGPDYAHLLAEVDIVRIHSLKHSLQSIDDIEDYSARYWSILRMQEAIESAQLITGRSRGEIELYASAFTTTSDDVVQGLVAGLPGASATLSLFTGLLELGADHAAAWGIAAGAPAETSLSYVIPGGATTITPQGAVYALMSQNLVGTQLVRTPTLDAARAGEYNIYAFTGAERSVFYVAANDLISGNFQLALDIVNGRPIKDFSVTVVSASNGLWGEAILSNRTALLEGSQITLDLKGDYEVIEVVVSYNEALPGGQMRFIGDAGPNNLIGTSGDEHLRGLGGNDRLVGTAGNDTLDGGSGVDMADFSQLTQDMSINMTRGIVQYDGATVTLTSIERLTAGNGTNTIVGSSGHDLILGGLRNDNIQGADGNDRLEGRDGRDRLVGGLGNDSLYGGAGNDSLLGGAANDMLFGGVGADTIFGGVGDDTITGGAQADRLMGEAGADIFIFGRSFGHDTLVDFNGDAGDLIDFSGLEDRLSPDSFEDVLLDARMNGTTLVIQLDADHSLTLLNTSLHDLKADYFLL
jgi:Ca2+-binding RTX toxin-like protein